DHHRCLLTNGRTGFRVRRGASITEGEHVGVPDVLHGALVDVDVAVRVTTGVHGRQRAVLDPVGRRLMRHGVQHVVGQGGLGTGRPDGYDGDFAARRVDRA